MSVSAAVRRAESARDHLSYLRAHLGYDASNVRGLAGIRSFGVLRGIRGLDGVPWATELLLRPPLDAVLQDTRAAGNAAAIQEIAAHLLRYHGEEEAKRVSQGESAKSAAMFSQLHDNRHAGQSGKHWLNAAAQPVDAQALAGGLALAQALFPQLWLGSQPGAAARPMSTKDVIALNSIFKGRWPFPGEGHLGGHYSSMDVGRLLFYAAVADGVVQPTPLTEKAFQAVTAKQGKHVRAFWRNAGLTFEHYSMLEAWLVEKAKSHQPPPPWAASASRVPTWPGTCVALCEYAQLVAELGIEAVREVITGG